MINSQEAKVIKARDTDSCEIVSVRNIFDSENTLLDYIYVLSQKSLMAIDKITFSIKY